MATVEKRPLTAEELDDARRLKGVWEEYRQKPENKGVSQTWLGAAAHLGNQSLIGQYLNGKIPLNLNALLAICRVIGCDPVLISPRLTKNIPGPAQTALGSQDEKSTNVNGGPRLVASREPDLISAKRITKLIELFAQSTEEGQGLIIDAATHAPKLSRDNGLIARDNSE